MDLAALAFDPVVPPFDAKLQALREALAADPTDVSSLRALFDLYQGHAMKDEACCVAEALLALHKASPGQTLWRGQHRPRDGAAARHPLTPQVLQDHIVHPDQDPFITAILDTIAPAVAKWRALPRPRDLDPHDRIDAAAHPSEAARMVQYARRVLGVDMPDLFFRPHDRGDYALLDTVREGALHPALVLFEGPLHKGQVPALGYVVGRAMADLFRPHFAFVALDRDAKALHHVLQACLQRTGHPATGDVGALDAIASAILVRMDPSAQQQLVRIVHMAVQAGADFDADRWADAAERTAGRVGLLLSGDLYSASLALQEDPSPLCAPVRTSARERLHELVRYGISDDYFAARRALGIDVVL